MTVDQACDMFEGMYRFAYDVAGDTLRKTADLRLCKKIQSRKVVVAALHKLDQYPASKSRRDCSHP
ncbi:MAG: hypothetical protein R3C19_00900 [Planctomycetaceae bacterium]